MRLHREPRARRQVPENLVRRHEGRHDFVRTKFEPEVCRNCFGKGYVYDVANNGDAPVDCPVCGGEGEV